MSKLAQYLAPCTTWRDFEQCLAKLHDEGTHHDASSIFTAFCFVLLTLEDDGSVYQWERTPRQVKDDLDLPKFTTAVNIIRRHADGKYRAVRCLYRSRHSINKIIKYGSLRATCGICFGLQV